MTFGEKIKNLRVEMGLSQADLARRIGVTERSIHNYEANLRYPKGQDVIRAIAETFGVTTDYLISEEPLNIKASEISFKDKDKQDMERILAEAGAMFAGGTLSEEDKDAFFQSLTQSYFAAKEAARKKYGRKNK